MSFYKKIKAAFLLVLGLGNVSVIFAYAPVNFNKPFDVNYRTNLWFVRGEKDNFKKFKVGDIVEYGSTKRSYNSAGDKVDLLSFYHDTQSSLAMARGARAGSDIDLLAQDLVDPIIHASDSRVLGRFKIDGEYEELAYTFLTQYNFAFETVPGKFDFSIYLPIRDMKIKDVRWTDQTADDAAGRLVKDLLTNDIHNNVAILGGLDLGGWSKIGLGDVALMLRWYHDFEQYKRNLKNVRVTGRVGLTLPTGRKKNEDKALSLPFGNDGAVSIPFTVGLDLFFKWKLKGGLELEIIKFLDETKVRRLKTDANQTDFLLLHKGDARKSFGNSWKFNLYAEAEHFFRGLSARIAYQYGKHDDDHLHVQDHNFNNETVNTAQTLQEWNYHNFIFQLSYDFFKETGESCLLKPQLSLFYKLPVMGRRCITAHTIGGQLTFNF